MMGGCEIVMFMMQYWSILEQGRLGDWNTSAFLHDILIGLVCLRSVVMFVPTKNWGAGHIDISFKQTVVLSFQSLNMQSKSSLCESFGSPLVSSEGRSLMVICTKGGHQFDFMVSNTNIVPGKYVKGAFVPLFLANEELWFSWTIICYRWYFLLNGTDYMHWPYHSWCCSIKDYIVLLTPRSWLKW